MHIMFGSVEAAPRQLLSRPYRRVSVNLWMLESKIWGART